VRALLENIAERAPIQANRVASLLSRIFNFAVDREIIENNPAYRLSKPGGDERVRDRVLSADEIKAVWRALDYEPVKERELLRLAFLTAARRSEVGDMAWPELDFDLGWWTIPAARVKNKREHRLPLVGEALAILRRLRAEAPTDSTMVFAGVRKGRPIATIQKAVERLKTRTGVEFRFHDIRRTAASEMARIGVDPVTVGRLLNHIQHSVTVKHYIRYSFDTEKKDAMLRWDSRLREIVTGEATPKVVNIHAGA
jgi:integrase